MINLLDQILLSDNVKENFHNYYNNDKFYNWIINILPEIKDCQNLRQDNPWHIYNCLDHILVSVEEVNKLSIGLSKQERRMLAYTMFLHDIGKPECYVRRYSKQYGKFVDSFFDHNKASVKIAERVLGNLNFTDKEQDMILTLVDNHDIFMFIVLKEDGNKYHKVLSREYVKTEIERLNQSGDGNKIMKYLMIVGKADNRAQNPAMTKDSLHKIDVMESMI